MVTPYSPYRLDDPLLRPVGRAGRHHGYWTTLVAAKCQGDPVLRSDSYRIRAWAARPLIEGDTWSNVQSKQRASVLGGPSIYDYCYQ